MRISIKKLIYFIITVISIYILIFIYYERIYCNNKPKNEAYCIWYNFTVAEYLR